MEEQENSEHSHHHDNEKHRPHRRGRKPIRPHPRPPLGSVNSLNEAIRQELWFVDTMVATPFRTARRQLESNHGSWAQGADEALWALEGMTRLPIKLVQAAFGEALKPGKGRSRENGDEGGDGEESREK